MSKDKYNQSEGHDSYKSSKRDGGFNSGYAEYNDDGTLKRLSNISESKEKDSHNHSWLNQKPDGTYEFGNETHKNH